MKLRPSCREVTALVLQGIDRPLRPLERVQLQLHWLACGHCRRFRQQQQLLQQALVRWRQDDDGAPD